MEIVIVADRASGGELVADAIARLLASRPDTVLGLATGSTPQSVYGALARRHDRGELDVGRVRGFQLDEYIGLPVDHPESYRSVIRREVGEPLGLAPEVLHGPDGTAEDLEAACAAYERAIEAAGGIDLQLLGIGSDGHIGFNEPMSSLASRTRIKTLTPRTRQDNARFFDGDLEAVPRHVLTQGIGTILRARHLVLMAWGEGKAEAVAAAVEGPLGAFMPASAVQLHPRATIVIDEAAATQLTRADYYRQTYASKPDWQSI